MNVGAVAGAGRFGDRREADAMSEPERDRLGEFAGDHGFIRGSHADGRRRGDLKLLRTELGEEGIGNHPDLPHRRQQRFAEHSLAPIRIELKGLPRMRGHAAVDKLLFEGGEQPQSSLAFQTIESAPQDVAGTEFPWRTLESSDVAQEEIFRRAAFERNEYASGGIGDEKNLAFSNECRLLDGADGRQKNIGRRKTDTAHQSRREIGRRKALAAKMPGKIAGSDEDNLFALHQVPLSDILYKLRATRSSLSR